MTQEEKPVRYIRIIEDEGASPTLVNIDKDGEIIEEEIVEDDLPKKKGKKRKKEET